MNRLALLHIDCDELNDILLAAAPRESGAFFLLREGRGARGRRLLAVDPMFPPADAWEGQHENQLRPSARWISAAISNAVTNRAGLLFVHSHPDPHHPIGFSTIDRRAIASLAETIGPILEGPFAAAVVHPEGWAAVVVDDGVLNDIPRIVSIGRNVRLLNALGSRLPHADEALDDRQRDALGTVHDLLRQLDLAVVGVGGIGSPIAEELVRMGTRSVTIVDDDVLDTPSNVRRVVGSSAADLGAAVPPAKVDVVGRHLDPLGLHVAVRRIKGDVRRERMFRELLDVDVVMCATDTHGSRAVLNDLASGYMLPVIDVGAQAGAKKNGDLAVLAVEVCVLTPVTPCLWCRKRISADVIRAENLPAEQRERLVREGYLVGGVGTPAPSVIALTTLGAGLATCALLALLSSEGEVCPSGYWVDGMMGDGLETQPHEPEVSCRCRGRIGSPQVQDAGYTVPDFRVALAKPSDVRDAQVVQLARSALAFRGFGRNEALFLGFPDDVEWWRARLDSNDFAKMRYGCEPSWVAFAPSRLVRDGAVAVSGGSTNGHAVKVAQIARDMAGGKQYDEIILVHTGDGNLILLEGWHRATAYVVCGMTADVSALVGVSERLDSWHWF